MPFNKGTMSLEVMMTPIHTSPSPSPSPQPVPAAVSSPIIKTTPNTPKVPAPSSPVQGLVERPYAPILPPATHSHERETVEALVGLASTGQLSPTTADLTSSFSAINVATLHNGPPNSYMRTSSEHNHSRNMSSRAIHSNEYIPDTAQPVGRSQDIRSTNGSSSKARRRRRSNSLGVESPRGHSKPYDGHILEEDTVVGDAAQPPRASSPQNYPQASQQDAHHGPRRLLPRTLVPSSRESKSKQQSHPQRQHLPPPPQSQSPRSQQALACPAQQPTVHYSKRTNKPQIPSTRPPRTYSADVHGFKLLRGAIPFQFAQAAANILDQGMEEVETTTTYKVFGLSLQAYRVRDEFMQNVSAYLSNPPSLEFSLQFRNPIFNFHAVNATALLCLRCLRCLTGSRLTLSSTFSML